MRGWSLADAARAGLNCSWAERDVDRGRSVIKRNVPKLANLPMEGYFRALYAPLGGLGIWREKASLTLTKLYFSMFRDKPPCTPLCFGTVDYLAGAFSSFLASTAAVLFVFAFSSSSHSLCFLFCL